MPERLLSFLPMVFLALAASASTASAHRMKVFATVVGATVEGKAYFVGGGPAGNVAATLRDGSDAVLAEGRTDGEGRFALAVPVRTDIAVVVDALDGHVARFAIAASRLPESLPAGEGAQPASPPPAGEAHAVPPVAIPAEEIAAAVARQIGPLAEQIDALEASIRLRDVLGGIGYIVGIFGLLAFLTARRRSTGGKTS